MPRQEKAVEYCNKDNNLPENFTDGMNFGVKIKQWRGLKINNDFIVSKIIESCIKS